MSDFLILYRAEIRKILMKKSFWAALAIGIAFVLVVGLTNLSAEGHLAYVKEQSEVLGELSGKPIDEAFLSGFQNEVAEELAAHSDWYADMMAYDPGAAFQNGAHALGKNELGQFLYNVVRDRERLSTVTEDEFYEMMRNNIIHDGREMGCSEEEIAAWLRVYDEVRQPMIYQYCQGYVNILDVLFLIGWVLFLNIAVALAGVFADEKAYRTDAMILSARKGRSTVCLAKIGAGITVSLMQCMVILGSCFGIMLSFFGIGGWNGAIQNVIPSSPWNITIGEMVLIYWGLAIITSILFALTNMAASHFTKSAIVSMAIHAAVLFVGLFNIPKGMGLISKLWELRPTMSLYYGTFCNTYLYGKMNNVQMSILIDGCLIALIFAALALSYRHSQVESR